jgi:Alkaline phosphatase PhoX
MRRRNAVAAVGTGALVLAAAGIAAISNTKPYTVGIADGYQTKRLISAGDTVPETSSPGKQYQMVGIPDGLGAHSNPDGTKTIFMNHELTSSTVSEPTIGDPLNRGALVSKLIVDAEGNVLSGERAYDSVFNENEFVGPAAAVGNSTRPFSRFCSGHLGGPADGLDRWIYFTNEEEGTPANSFDGKGGLTVAITDNTLYTLPKLGRFAWENSILQPNHGTQTVIMSMEDGPAALDAGVENSQVYMYVGKKDRSSGAGVLRRNGLDNGELYVLVPSDPSNSSEAAFASGSIEVEWALIPDADELDEAQLEAASDAVGAIRFGRPEDGAFNKRDRDEYFFVTTGEASGGANTLGRLYSLRLHPGNVTKGGTLSVVYNADTVIAAGGDIAISPDNIDVSENYLMINEDGTASSRTVMGSKGRDGSIWRFDIVHGKVGVDASSAVRVAELDPPGRDGVPVGPGIWETSGIIDASTLFGEEAWLFDVQAHSPTTAPAPNTVEDGQLLLMTRSD